MASRTGLLIVGHGSRDAGANVEFEELVARYRAGRPDLEVAHGYIELARPSLPEALLDLGARTRRVVVMPLFLFAAGHVKNDIPLALDDARRRLPEVRFAASRALGVHPSLAELAFERLRSVFDPTDGAGGADRDASRTAVIVVGRGSSDPDANGDFCKLVRLLGERRGFLHVEPTFIGITRPLVEETIELVARARPERIVVVPYFLFGGRLIAKLSSQVREFAARYPWIKTVLAPHLGADARLFDLIDQRAREAIEGEGPLPCDTCQYRTPLPGREDNVGGLRAMLWSLRHGFTHAQAMPHVHAHRPLTRHVLVCGNVDCAGKGSVGLVESIRRLVKDAGRERDIRVTRTSCMGRCGEGPTVAVYPDGIWYRGVAPGDAAELVHEHLLGDRLVARLVDSIMQ